MFTNALVADMVIRGLYENNGLYNFVNRSFDGLVREGLTSVEIPKNPQLVVKKTGTATDSADRKKDKTDTDMVSVPFEVYTVPVAEEIEGAFAANGQLIQNFVDDAVDALTEQFDKDIIAEAQTTNVILSPGGPVSWTDVILIRKTFRANKIPGRDLVVVVPTALEEEFMSIDVVKMAMANNKDLLEEGVVRINGMNFYISANVEKVGGKENLVGISGPNMAFVLKNMMERKEVYNTSTRKTDIDYNSYAAKKLMRQAGAVVVKKD